MRILTLRINLLLLFLNIINYNRIPIIQIGMTTIF